MRATVVYPLELLAATLTRSRVADVARRIYGQYDCEMRYRLRSLLILLAIMPPFLAVVWVKYSHWRDERERRKANAVAVQLAIQAVLRQGRVLTPMFLDGVDEINNPSEPDDSN